MPTDLGRRLTASTFLPVLLALGSLLGSPAPAQDILDADAIERAFAANHATLFVLTEGSDLGSGSFDIGATDVSVTRFSGQVPLVGHEEDEPDPFVVPLLGLSVGYSNAEEASEPGPPFGRLTSVEHAFGFLIDAGARFGREDGTSVSPRLGLGYLHIESRLFSDGDLSALDPLAGALFDWDAEVVAWVPGLEVAHAVSLGSVDVRAYLDGSAIGTEVVASTDPIQDADSLSGLVSIGVDGDVPLGASVLGCALHLCPSAVATAIIGDSVRALESEYLLTGAASLEADVKGRVPFLSRLGVGGSYTVGRDIEGWSVGAAFTLHFGPES